MKEINGFEIQNYNVHNFPEGVRYSVCPKCSHTRKKKTQKCVSIKWHTGLANCNHCGEMFQLHTFKKKNKDKIYKVPEWQNNTELSKPLVKWFEGRKISQFILRIMKISEGIEIMPHEPKWKKKNTVQFPYYRYGEIVNVKYRGGDKSFKLCKDAEKIAYNLDRIQGEEIIYCVEGEMDVLAVMESGIHNVCSPPNGFTEKGNVNLDWLNADVESFIKAEKIILAFDNDIPGENGKKEFIRRFGAHKCYSIDLKECKDSNEFLIKYGVEELKKALENHIEIPLEDVSTYNDYKENVRDFFINGMPKGLITGTLKGLDKIFSTEYAQIILVTGKPSSGKSEVVDQMCIGYALNSGHKIAFASVENKPNQLHHQKLIRKLHGKAPKNISDFNGAFEACEKFADRHFYMIDLEGSYDLDRVLMKAEELVYRKGIRVLVMDPFNKIRYKGEVENISGNRTNDYTNTYLSKIDEFGRKFNVVPILVAHPIKLPKLENGKRAVPDMYDVKGGGEVYDMCHHGLAVDRDYDRDITLIRTLKVKFAHLGENNADTYVKYNINNGRYSEIKGDVDNPEGYDIIWDNNDWITTQDKQAKQKDIFDNSDLENNSDNWYEKDNEESPF